MPPIDYGYDLIAARDGWGWVQALGDVVTVYSPCDAWPRCMSCDSIKCDHIQEMYSRAGIRMPDAVCD